MTSSFKAQNPLERRKEESARIRSKYPDRCPVIVERAPRSNIADIDKQKYVVRRGGGRACAERPLWRGAARVISSLGEELKQDSQAFHPQVPRASGPHRRPALLCDKKANQVRTPRADAVFRIAHPPPGSSQAPPSSCSRLESSRPRASVSSFLGPPGAIPCSTTDSRPFFSAQFPVERVRGRGRLPLHHLLRRDDLRLSSISSSLDWRQLSSVHIHSSAQAALAPAARQTPYSATLSCLRARRARPAGRTPHCRRRSTPSRRALRSPSPPAFLRGHVL